MGLDDFDVIQSLGKGAFARVDKVCGVGCVCGKRWERDGGGGTILECRSAIACLLATGCARHRGCG